MKRDAFFGGGRKSWLGEGWAGGPKDINSWENGEYIRQRKEKASVH